MKIALYYNLRTGGAKRCIYELTKRLSEKHSIDVYTLSSSDREYCNLDPFAKNTFVYDYQRTRSLRFPLSRFNWIIQLSNLSKLEKIQRKIADDINNKGYDLVFSNTCVDTNIPLIIKYLKKPVVYLMHSMRMPFIVSRDEEYVNFLRRITRKIFPDLGQKIYNSILDKKRKENIQKTSLVLAVSDYLRDRIITEYGIPAKTCYPGVDFNRFVPDDLIKKENLVLTVGGIQARKSHDFVIESVGLIDKEIRPSVGIAYLECVDKEKEYLIKLADSKNVNLEFFKNEDMVLLYNKAKIVIFTSYFEGLGFVTLEGMACRTPAIGVNEGGIRETILHEKTGFLLDRDKNKFAKAIRYLLKNEDIAKKYGEEGRKYVVENWSWDKSADGLERHFCDVILNKK